MRDLAQPRSEVGIALGAGSVSEFYEWFDESMKGDRLTYHIGDLQYDRNAEHFPQASSEKRRDIAGLDALAIRVLAFVREGKVHAFQRRIMDGVSEYVVEKR